MAWHWQCPKILMQKSFRLKQNSSRIFRSYSFLSFFFSEKSFKSIHLSLFTAPPSLCLVPKAMYSMSVEERMGPGGLDPVEVFESLPAELQECILAAATFFLFSAACRGKRDQVYRNGNHYLLLWRGVHQTSNLQCLSFSTGPTC